MIYFSSDGLKLWPQCCDNATVQTIMRKTSRTTYLIALACFSLGLVCLVASGLRAGSAYFVTVAEALALSDPAPSAMKLFGVVAQDTPAPRPLGQTLNFTLIDAQNPAQTVAVRFNGALPPLFKPGAEIIARGIYDPNQRTLAAEELITKCPAKYEKQNRKDNP